VAVCVRCYEIIAGEVHIRLERRDAVKKQVPQDEEFGCFRFEVSSQPLFACSGFGLSIRFSFIHFCSPVILLSHHFKLLKSFRHFVAHSPDPASALDLAHIP
jgi:hypothetical protein